jgi:hypothetical protein
MDSIMSVDPDPVWKSGPGSRRAKTTLKNSIKERKCLMLKAEGLFCSLDVLVLYGDLGIGKLQFFINKYVKNSSSKFFVTFWSSKP